MPEDDKRKFDIPWATLLPVIAALAGIAVQFRPLVSSRPSIPSEKAIEIVAAQDVDARLWQDPLVVAQKAKSQLDADLLTKNVPANRVTRHQIGALVELFRQSAAAQDGRTLLLAVMLDSGPYIEQGESRLRARQAVLEGLNESGFVPADSEHIGFVTTPGIPSPIWNKPNDKPVEDGARLIPWEECRMDTPERVYPRGTQRAFVLWLPAASFNPNPLSSFADLIRPFVEGIHDRVDVKLIGPANSTGLQYMIREAQPPKEGSLPAGNLARDEVLDGVSIISALATAPASALLHRAATEDELQQTIESCVKSHTRGGLHFNRTITTDDVVLKALIDELKLRQVDVANGDHVVLLTEWDSEYGRSLATTFEEVAGANANLTVASRINSFRYMHGIDGRLPGDLAKTTPPDSASKTQPMQGSATMVEATEGLDQSDFLRRLARELKDQDTTWWRKGERGIRAIGVLGSDIYDKLMILRALHPEFHDTIFFTNNFDAHFERRDDWNDTRNLVVSSPFGSTLPPIKEDAGWEFFRHLYWMPPWTRSFEQRAPPFRDNNQTSMFTGTLVATGRLDVVALWTELFRQPRLFEISRRGSHELYQQRFAGREDWLALKNSHWFWDWIRLRGVRSHLGLAVVALLLLIGWIGLSSVDQRLPGGGSWLERIKRVCSSTLFWLVCGVPFIVIGVATFSQFGQAQEEPLAFFSGISIWPSEMLRLIALLLAIHFMFKASFDLSRNEREVTKRFFPGGAPSERWHWRNPRMGLRRWQKEYPQWVGTETPFSAKDAWSAYLIRNQFWPRFIRVSTLFAIYFCFSFGIFTLFPFPLTPARGTIAFIADLVALYPTIIGMMFLTFYVVDAIRLNSNFIRIFAYGMTKWEPDISLGSGRIPPLEEKDLARYHDIFFVAQRTEAVAPLIWYPLIVLILMFVARSSFFDHWTWPLSLILVFVLNALWALGSAGFLRRAAERLRESAITSLQRSRAARFLDIEKRQTFDELIAEIRALKKGAFAPLTEQPFIRAIIFPSGGLGLLAVGQRLFDLF